MSLYNIFLFLCYSSYFSSRSEVYFKVFFIVFTLIRDKIVLFTQRSILHIFEMLAKMLSRGSSTDVKFNPPCIKHACIFMRKNQRIPRSLFIPKINSIVFSDVIHFPQYLIRVYDKCS